MNSLFEKWHNDSKYRAKIKLSIYAVFIVIITLYAISLNKSTEYISKNEEQSTDISDNMNMNQIKLSDNYSYKVTINIDDMICIYNIKKEPEEVSITKTIDDITTNYILKDGEYYKENEEIYIKTSRSDVYDKVNYNYIDIENINLYLEKAEKNNQEYLVFLKDIILNENSDDYFVITMNDNHINIDYTPLINKTNPDIYKYQVDIIINK